jgi:phage tail-like protein
VALTEISGLSAVSAARQRAWTSHAEAEGVEEAPPVVSSSGYMRRGLPAIFQDGDLAMNFVGALERVLDPVVALLDSLDHHFDPYLAPPDLLEFLAAWLGMELDESWPEERRREIVRRAGELHRLRGTRAGLELALRITFPALPLRIEDAGGVTWSLEPPPRPAPAGPTAEGARAAAEPAAADGPPGFVVYCDTPIAEPIPALLARTIGQLKPADVGYRLRIRTPEGSPS